jgi:hypothetical protein
MFTTTTRRTIMAIEVHTYNVDNTYMEEKRKAFPAWLKEFRRKNDFASCLITPNYHNMLFEAYFEEEEKSFDEIYCWIEADKMDAIRGGQDEERLSFCEDEEARLNELRNKYNEYK